MTFDVTCYYFIYKGYDMFKLKFFKKKITVRNYYGVGLFFQESYKDCDMHNLKFPVAKQVEKEINLGRFCILKFATDCMGRDYSLLEVEV